MTRLELPNPPPRLVWPDILRVVSAFAVVFLHVSASYQKGVSPFDGHAWMAILCRLFGAFAVPVFFMLSGMFFLDPLRALPDAKIVRASKRLLRAFFFWSAVYLVILPGRPSFPPKVGDIARLFHGAAPLWFLAAILSCYLFAPALRVIANDLNVERRTLIVALCLLIVPETLRPLSPFFAVSFPGTQHISIISFPVFYFLLGDYLHRTTFSSRKCKVVYALGFLGFLAMFAVRCWAWRKGGDRLHDGASPVDLWVVLYSCAIFVLFKSMGSRSANAPSSQWLGILSGATFGVYLMHELFMFGMRFGFGLFGVTNPFEACSPIGIFPESIIVFVLSAMTALFFKKLRFLKTVV